MWNIHLFIKDITTIFSHYHVEITTMKYLNTYSRHALSLLSYWRVFVLTCISLKRKLPWPKGFSIQVPFPADTIFNVLHRVSDTGPSKTFMLCNFIIHPHSPSCDDVFEQIHCEKRGQDQKSVCLMNRLWIKAPFRQFFFSRQWCSITTRENLLNILLLGIMKRSFI